MGSSTGAVPSALGSRPTIRRQPCRKPSGRILTPRGVPSVDRSTVGSRLPAPAFGPPWGGDRAQIKLRARQSPTLRSEASPDSCSSPGHRNHSVCRPGRGQQESSGAANPPPPAAVPDRKPCGLRDGCSRSRTPMNTQLSPQSHLSLSHGGVVCLATHIAGQLITTMERNPASMSCVAWNPTPAFEAVPARPGS